MNLDQSMLTRGKKGEKKKGKKGRKDKKKKKRRKGGSKSMPLVYVTIALL